MWIDSHCHLSSSEILKDLPEIMERARNAGIATILNAGGSFNELQTQLEIAQTYPNVFTLTGVHPHEASNYADITAEDVLKNTRFEKVVGIGECGLDYFYDFSPKETQIKVFKEMIKAAQESELPLVVHTREAESDTIELLSAAYQKKKFTAVIHCYSSNWSLAEESLKMGFYIFPPIQEKYVLKKMNSLHRKYRKQFADCEIYPMGEQPNGKAVTGFIAWNKKSGKTFLLVFREQYSKHKQTVISLPYTRAEKWKILSGDGNISGVDKGVVKVELAKKQYIFAESVKR